MEYIVNSHGFGKEQLVGHGADLFHDFEGSISFRV